MTQWHPVFAQLLRPAVEAYYEVHTTVPVGDAPREADFVLLRRTTSAPLPFRGLWQHLTNWNILHPTAWKEVQAMARTAGKALQIDLRPAIEALGLGYVLEQVGIDRLIEHVGEKELIKRIGLERILATLSPAQRRELKRRLE